MGVEAKHLRSAQPKPTELCKQREPAAHKAAEFKFDADLACGGSA